MFLSAIFSYSFRFFSIRLFIFPAISTNHIHKNVAETHTVLYWQVSCQTGKIAEDGLKSVPSMWHGKMAAENILHFCRNTEKDHTKLSFI